MDFGDICRTCLSTENLYPIFVEPVDHESHSADIFTTTGIKVDANDGLPQQMCMHCISFTNESLKFRKQCQEAQTRLVQVKQEYDIAETADNAAESGDYDDGVLMEIKAEDFEADGDASTSEVGGEAEDYSCGQLSTTEEDPLRLQPADEAGAERECNNICPEEPPRHTSPQPEPEPRNYFVRLDRFPIEYHTKNSCIRPVPCVESAKKLDELSKESPKVSKRPRNPSNWASKRPGIFACFSCNIDFSSKQALVHHVTTAHLNKNSIKPGPECVETPEKLDEPKEPSNHQTIVPQRPSHNILNKTLGKPGFFRCFSCDVDFSTKQALESHVAVHISINVRESTTSTICITCGKQFKCPSLLVTHMRRHTGETPFACDICKKRFSSKGSLTQHIYGHLGRKQYGCDICDKRFLTSARLSAHLRIHTGERPFGCIICGRRFNQRAHLVIHKRIHTGERPFACSVCDKNFTYQTTFNSHMNTHKSSDSGPIRRRVRTKVLTNKLLTCDICKKQVDSSVPSDKLIDKLGMFTCDLCKERFQLAGDLTEHSQDHIEGKPFFCSGCGKKFDQIESLERHVRLHL